MKKTRYAFSLLGMFILSLFTALLLHFRKPVQEVRHKIRYVRQPRRRMTVFMAAFALLLLFCVMALPAFAGDGSFNTTNNLINGTQYNLYPTNATGLGTGSGIDVRNYKSVGIYVSCDVSNNAAAKVGFSLVRADKVTTSGITNWETTTVYGCLVSIPAMTNHFDWMTNLPEDFAGCAVKVGLSTLTNNLASAQIITNLDIGVIKKLTTIQYP